VRKKIYFYQTLIPQYRVPSWRRLSDAVDGELIVVYGQPADEHIHVTDSQFPFSTCQVMNHWLAGERLMLQPFWQPFLEYGRPDVVISSQNPRTISLFLLFAYCRAASIPIVLYGHGGSRKRRLLSSRHPADTVHKWFIRHCDAFICYTDEVRNELAEITNSGKLFVARNTLDTDILFALRRRLSREGRGKIRHRLNLTKSDHYLCFIGRLVEEKRVDLLLRVLFHLQAENVNVGVVVIGDGPRRRYLEELAMSLDLKDVHFTGTILKWELSAPYLYASDVLVNPGYVGLSVNHAFSFGLPVVTQEQGEEGPFHSPEVTFIETGRTGFFARNNDIDDLVEKVMLALQRVETMRMDCIRYAEEELSVERMISGFIDGLEYVQAN
jgi:glycosyltransferase involved in cell wall biosynthesis